MPTPLCRTHPPRSYSGPSSESHEITHSDEPEGKHTTGSRGGEFNRYAVEGAANTRFRRGTY